jgi:hypothetical protein
MAAVWSVQEIRVRENWKCASVETPEVLEARRAEVVGHDDVTRR